MRRKTPETPPTPGMPSEELRRRVLYTLMLPAVRLGFLFRTPLKDLGRLLQMGSFHEMRRRGLKTHEVAELLDVSARKVALLSRQLKDNFFEADRAHGLPRRIEFMLWAQPLSAARIKQVLTEEAPEEIDAALAQLEAQGRVSRAGGRTEAHVVVKSQYRLVDPHWMARLDGLENLAATVSNAVYARFFRDEPAAFARTISLRVRPQDLERLQSLYEQKLWPELVALDEAAHGDPEARPMDVSLLIAPYEYIQHLNPEEETP